MELNFVSAKNLLMRDAAVLGPKDTPFIVRRGWLNHSFKLDKTLLTLGNLAKYSVVLVGGKPYCIVGHTTDNWVIVRRVILGGKAPHICEESPEKLLHHTESVSLIHPKVVKPGEHKFFHSSG